MSGLTSRYFSEQDRERIKQAVGDAEQRTSGEIVPYVVEESDTYDEAIWRAASFAGLLMFTALVVMVEVTPLWVELDFVGTLLLVLCAGILGGVIARYVHPVKRVLLRKSEMDRRVAQRAAEAFLEEEVFDTRDRTGILIFLSLFEHEVIVIGDSGLNKVVEKAEWHGIANGIAAGIRRGAPAEALVEGIQKCGNLLAIHGLARSSRDTNELGDSFRTGTR